MAFFETIEQAVAFVWALPLGIGKIFSTVGGFYVGIKGVHFLANLSDYINSKDKK